MRIVAGQFKGRKIRPPISQITRPTSDRTRETIFNILTHQLHLAGQTFADHTVLDVFAGTGALGLEALSRGAGHATFIERDRTAMQVLKANIQDLNVVDKASVICADATFLREAPQPFSLIFLDPPYHKNLLLPALDALLKGKWLNASATIVCETGPQEDIHLSDQFHVRTVRPFGHCKIFILIYQG